MLTRWRRIRNRTTGNVFKSSWSSPSSSLITTGAPHRSSLTLPRVRPRRRLAARNLHWVSPRRILHWVPSGRILHWVPSLGCRILPRIRRRRRRVAWMRRRTGRIEPGIVGAIWVFYILPPSAGWSSSSPPSTSSSLHFDLVAVGKQTNSYFLSVYALSIQVAVVLRSKRKKGYGFYRSGKWERKRR